jgi:hypothetical protein
MSMKHIIQVSISTKPAEQGAVGAPTDKAISTKTVVLQEGLDAEQIAGMATKYASEIYKNMADVGTLFETSGGDEDDD